MTRDQWSQEHTECMVCGWERYDPSQPEKWTLETHEIARGIHRQAALTCKPNGKYGVSCVGGTVYCFEGYLFEVHRYFGPLPLNKRTHDPRSTVPAGFWEMWDRFEKLSVAERAACTVDGNKNTKG